MKKLFVTLFALSLAIVAFCASDIKQVNNGIKLTFDNAGGSVKILRSTGKFSPFTEIATSTGTTYTDNTIGANPYEYYYQIVKNDKVVVTLSLETKLFGKNVYFYHKTDDQEKIATEINTIHDAMQYDQFSENRYSFYFHKGSYLETGDLKIAYYMSIAGLGKLPYDVSMFYLVTPPPLPDNNATCTFWRSAENFEVIATNDAVMSWGVSQAAPLRRVVMNRPCQFDYWYGWASGGFAADCYFAQDAGSYSQQQFYLRNCYMQNGQGNYNGGWNFAMQGIEFGPGTDMEKNSDNWKGETFEDISRNWGNNSREEVTPVIREKPFLFFDEVSNRFKVFKPALREKNSKGISFSKTNMGAGEIFDLINDFYIATPNDDAAKLNEQLRAGKHIFFTPGQYILQQPLYVTKENTILLGTGYATLIPGNDNSVAAVVVGDVDGVTVASLLFDTFYSSENLLRVGQKISTKDHSANPTLLADLFFRIGGFKPWKVNVDVALKINSSDVIGDHFWIWRADHGDGVGWDSNTCKNGIVVEGQNVTVYGLFNEHFQQYQTLWKGENGRMYFYQCETPYDVLDQDDYLSHGQEHRSGFASYKVAPDVKKHYASMMGIYDVFINTGGAEIKVANSIEVPKRPGVHVHHACNTCISNVRAGFDHIINDSVESTFHFENISGRRHIVDYEYPYFLDEGEVMPEDESGNEGSKTPEWSAATGEIDAIEETNAEVSVSVYPNPMVSYLSVSNTENEAMNVAIYSLSGSCLYSGEYNQPIYVGNLSNGYYIVNVSTQAGTQNFKVVKQ